MHSFKSNRTERSAVLLRRSPCHCCVAGSCTRDVKDLRVRKIYCTNILMSSATERKGGIKKPCGWDYILDRMAVHLRASCTHIRTWSNLKSLWIWYSLVSMVLETGEPAGNPCRQRRDKHADQGSYLDSENLDLYLTQHLWMGLHSGWDHITHIHSYPRAIWHRQST